ncbi:MAG: protein kinase, partial [Myxococcota bacterium]
MNWEDRDDSVPTMTVDDYGGPEDFDDHQLTGRTLGDFVLKERIGQGGFGSVYRAHQVTLSREVVVKVQQWGGEDGDRIQRFLREAHLASQLDHPYAAHIYAFGLEQDDLLWIAMEFVRGTPLSDVLDTRGPLPLRQFAPLLEKICEVLYT